MPVESSSDPVYVRANGIELCYDAFGDAGAPPLLLIMGLAAQMIAWDEEFCEALASRGYRVIRFDNRDIAPPASKAPACPMSVPRSRQRCKASRSPRPIC